jgi:hypothetical protein
MEAVMKFRAEIESADIWHIPYDTPDKRRRAEYWADYDDAIQAMNRLEREGNQPRGVFRVTVQRTIPNQDAMSAGADDTVKASRE